MSFSFNNKIVYLLSSDRWGTMRVSKHHYALELAEKGNKVFFIEPPDLQNRGISITSSEDHPSLFIVKYKPVFRGKRILPGFLFRFFLILQIRLLIRKIGQRPDIVWSFDPYRFNNLNWFKASVKIFFAADLFYYDHLPEEALTADLCLGVSDTIVELLKRACKTAQFINHGVSRHFTNIAKETLLQLPATNQPISKITVGYVGNLLMEAPDRITIQKVISAHPDIQFIFWGQYEKNGNFGAYDKPEVFDFIKFLQSQPNVTLRGAVHPSVLSEEIKKADMFWICWQTSLNKMWDGSNSHKILEYLSTGKPVVSHYMSTYRNSNIIYMLPSKEDNDYLSLFSQVLNRVKWGEPVELHRKRILLAMENSYQSHIAEIEKLIQPHFS